MEASMEAFMNFRQNANSAGGPVLHYLFFVWTKEELFDQTQLCKLRVILRSCVLRVVHTFVKDTGRRLPC